MRLVIQPDHPALKGKTGRGVVVATIDSGVASGHPHVGIVSNGTAMYADGSVKEDFTDRIGHGTAVAAAIREKAPAAEILAVKVFHDSLATDAATLVRALEWSVDAGAHLINLSLGTANPEHAALLAAAVRRAMERGTLVVSAAEHNGVRWFPGSSEHAFPVVYDPTCDRMGIALYHRDGRHVFGASGLPRPIPGVPADRNLRGISFAVANVTGVLARLLEGGSHPATPAWVYTRFVGSGVGHPE